MLNYDDDKIKDAHIREQFEGAAEDAMRRTVAAEAMLEESGYEPFIAVDFDLARLLKSSLFAKWKILARFRGEEATQTAPDLCPHLSFGHPEVWHGLLACPDFAMCSECFNEMGSILFEGKRATCDVCDITTSRLGVLHVPIGNIQVSGMACESCVNRAVA